MKERLFLFFTLIVFICLSFFACEKEPQKGTISITAYTVFGEKEQDAQISVDLVDANYKLKKRDDYTSTAKHEFKNINFGDYRFIIVHSDSKIDTSPIIKHYSNLTETEPIYLIGNDNPTVYFGIRDGSLWWEILHENEADTKRHYVMFFDNKPINDDSLQYCKLKKEFSVDTYWEQEFDPSDFFEELAPDPKIYGCIFQIPKKGKLKNGYEYATMFPVEIDQHQ